MNPAELSIISPVYNEEENVDKFYKEIKNTIGKIGISFELIFCLDPSDDNTEKIIKDICLKDESVSLIKMSRKFGQAACTIAGIENSVGNYCIVIDADFQDPVDLIPDLYSKIKTNDYDVINAKRNKREGLNNFYKIFSSIGYKILNSFSDVKIPENVGDFRIFNRKIANHIISLKESHNFLRGLISFVGFKQGEISFTRPERKLGKTKYSTIFGSLKIAFNGFIGYSNFFLTLLFYVGIALLIIAIIIFLVISYDVLISETKAYPIGVPSIIFAVIFLGAINIISVGILGLYIARIYDEVRSRPKYIVDEKINIKK